MAKWTKEQLEVIESRDMNQLVSAAAGSGKTAVLINRIVELIKEGRTSVEGLLVVTFTKAAAAEMKERLHAELVKALETGNEQTEFIRQQINGLSKAQISTIHAFCKEVVKDHFQVLGLDPNFRVASGPELEKMQDRAMEQIMEKAYKKGQEAFHTLLESYTKARSDEPLREMIMKIYEFARTHADPEAFLDEVVLRYESNGGAFWEVQLRIVLRVQLSGLVEAYRQSLEQQRSKGVHFYLSTYEADLEQLSGLESALEDSVECFQIAYSAMDYKRLPVLSKKMKEALSEEEITELESIKAIRNDLKDFARKKISIYCVEPIAIQIKELTRMGPVISCLIDLVRQFGSAYLKLKMEKAMIDFSDLEHFTIEMLQNPDVAKVYQSRFDFVFTDEYQDSNRVQEFILEKVSRGRNRFMVGDLKQSIYKFRLADPTLFIETYKRYDNGEAGSRKHDLNRNFRSAESIVRFVNSCFKPLMRADFGGIAYDEDNQLYTGASFEFQVPVEVHLIDREGAKESDVTDSSDLPEVAYAEAMEAADAIHELVGKAYHYDAKNQQARLIQYSDIVILQRSAQTASRIYREVFFERRIPLYTESQTGYFSAVEVEVFLQFLRLIDNITLDLPLMTVMKSMIGGFTVEELIEVRLKTVEKNFHAGIQAYIRNFDDQLAQKLSGFMDRIVYFQELARQHSLDTFIWRLLLETDYYYSLGALYLGESKQANLRLLINRAKEYLQGDQTSLHGFLGHIDDLARKEVDFSEARLIHEKDNVVKMMTIHKSKGLEYPVVLLAGLGKRFNEMDLRDPVICHETVGLSTSIIDPLLRYRKSSLSERIVKYRMRREMLEEELRILYVALTRAVHRLILIGSLRSLSKSLQKWIQPISGYGLFGASTLLDYVMMALGNGVFSAEELLTLGEDKFLSGGEQNPIRISVKELMPQHMLSQKDQVLLDEADFYNRLHNADSKLFSGFELPYPHQSAISLPMKISVTEYKKMRMEKNVEQYHVPELAPLTSPVTMGGAIRGTQIHSILEHFRLPYSDFGEAYRQTTQYLLEKGVVTEEVLKTITMDELKSFFESPVGMRMQRALSYRREQPFVLQVSARELYSHEQEDEKMLLQGVIDLYFEEPDGLVLIDYKSDQLGKQQLDHWQERYAMTLELYTTALEQLLGKPVKERYIYSTYNRDFIVM